jgi:tetratricopeptide (TPR) repeat protein
VQAPRASPADSAATEHLKAQALEEGEANKTEDAIRDYRIVLQAQPGWKEGWWNLGMLEYTRGDFREARTAFERVAGLAPEVGEVWGILGLSEYQSGDYDDALTHLRRAQSIGIKDDDEIARVSTYHLALLMVRASEFEAASEQLLSSFGAGDIPSQAKIALGLATLRAPVLPEQLDPSMESVVLETGEAAISGTPEGFAALVRGHPELPYLRLAYGRALARAGRDKEALEAFAEEAKASPGSPLPWLESSRIEQAEGRPTEAIEAAQRAVRLAPENAEAHRLLAESWEKLGNREQAVAEEKLVAGATAEHGKPEERIVRLYVQAGAGEETRAAGTAVVSSERADEDQWKHALRAYVAQDYAAAAADLTAWLVRNPSSGTGWALLGLCEFSRKDYDGALLHLDRSAKLGLKASSESIDQARYTYGILLVHAGRFDEADTILAAMWHPTGEQRDKVEFALGLSLLRRTEFPDAVSAEERELVVAAGRIAVLVQQSKYEDAFPLFKGLVERYPRAPFVHYAYGTALIAYSEFDQAAAQMQAERAISPQSELPCLRLSSIALRQHDAPTAANWAQCALDLAPDSVDAHYLLGRASLEEGETATAIHELETAARLSPASPEIHFNLARAYSKARMTDKAERERETFSRLNAAQKAEPPKPASP